MLLKERVKEFLAALGLPKSRFAANVGISVGALKRWLADDLQLSLATQNRIDEFLRRFNS